MLSSHLRLSPALAVLLLLALLALLTPRPAVAGAAPAAHPLTVVQADRDRVLLAWQAPPLTLEPAAFGDEHLVTPRFAGVHGLAAPGEPDLPAATILLALPPGATAVATVLADSVTPVALPAPVAAVPVLSAPVDPREPLPGPALSSPPSRAALRPGLTPADVVTVAPPVRWRSQRVVRVRVNPVQLDATRGQLLLHTAMQIEVRFVGGARAQAVQSGVDEGAFEPLLATHIGNYAAARSWRQPPARTAGVPAAPPAGPWLRITTAHAGLHRLPCADLAAAGLELAAIDPATLRLYRDGPGQTEVALWLDATSDDCGAQGTPLFYAEAVATPYTDQAVYWLTYGGAPGLRMASQPSAAEGAPVTTYGHTARYEVNRLYYSFIPLAENAHHWYWDILATATGASRTYTFTVPALASGPGQLTLDLAGYDGAHRTAVTLNDQAVADLTWQGRVAARFDLTLSVASLVTGVNRLTIRAAGGAGDYQYMDGFTVTTPQPLAAVADQIEFAAAEPGPQRYSVAGFTTQDLLIFDVSDPQRPQRVTGATVSAAPCPCTVTFGASGPARYLLTSRAARHEPVAVARPQPFTLHDAANQADYLLIAPAEFHAALAPLAAFRTAQGLRTQIIDLQAVYDEFGGGEVDPFALRTFLLYTLTGWQAPAPAYVLLVGDGVNDPRGFVDPPPAHTLPALLRTVDPRLGETASDNQYVTFDDGDNLPQFALGRFPVSTVAAVAALVAKTLRYEQQAAPGAWRQRIAVVADNAYAADGAPDVAGNFWALADGLVEQPAIAAAGYQVDRFYYNPCPPAAHPDCLLPEPPQALYADAGSLTAALLAALDAGRQLLVYVGHGSPTAWSGNPSLLTAADAATLANPERLTVTLEMTCYTGYFQAPRQAALAEVLLAAPGGAVAAWASSGVSVATGHDALARGFLAAVAQDEAAPIGLAAVAGKVALWTEGGGAYRENIDTFHLFGDPALRLARGEGAAVFLPWVVR